MSNAIVGALANTNAFKSLKETSQWEGGMCLHDVNRRASCYSPMSFKYLIEITTFHHEWEVGMSCCYQVTGG